MKLKRRTKQVEEMIRIANKRFKENKIYDIEDSVFQTLAYMLLETGLYRGYNWCYEVEVGGVTIERLTGCWDEEELKKLGGYLKLY